MTGIRVLLPVALAFSLAAGAMFAIGRLVQFEDGRIRSAVTISAGPLALEDIEWSSAVVTPGAQQAQVLERQLALAVVVALILALTSVLTALAYELLRGSSRRSEVAVHRAVGASLRTLGRAAALEGGLLTMFGVVTGWALGSSLAGVALSTWPGGVEVGQRSGHLLFPAVVLAGAFFAVSYGSWWAATGAGTATTSTVVRPPPADPYSGIAILQVAGSVALLVAATVLVGVGRDHGGSSRSAADARSGDGTSVVHVRGANALDTLRLLASLRLVPGVSSAWVMTEGAAVGLGTTDIALTECGRCWIGTSPVNIKGGDVVHHAVAWVGPQAPFELLAGRPFGPEDGPNDEPVAVVSESFAQKHFEGGDAIGRRVRPGTGLGEWHRVIGISSTGLVRSGFGSTAQPDGEVYLSAVQHPGRSAEILVAGAVDGASLLEGIRRAAGDVDVAIRSLQSHVQDSHAPARWLGWLFGILGMVALLCSLLGVRAVTRLSLRVRRAQFGIHRAVGANRRAIANLALGQPLRASLIGTALGLYGSMFFLDALSEAVGVPIPPLEVLFGIGVLHVCAALIGAIPVTVRFVRSSPQSLISGAR